MTEILEALGIYGGSALVAFIAGMFPPFSIEVFLLVVVAAVNPTAGELTLACACAAVGHQIAKTICYYAGVGMLESGKLKAKLDKVRHKIDKWNKAPKTIMTLGAVVGIPPMYLLAFIAEPIMRMRFVPFTLIVFFGRLVRFIFLAGIPLVL